MKAFVPSETSRPSLSRRLFVAAGLTGLAGTAVGCANTEQSAGQAPTLSDSGFHGGPSAASGTDKTPPLRPFSTYTYEWLLSDADSAGTDVQGQPPLPKIIEPKAMPRVESRSSEAMIDVTDRRIRLGSAYYTVGWPAAQPGAYLRESVAGALSGVADSLPANFGLLILDSWRPLQLQQQIFEAAYTDRRLPSGFVSTPSTDPATPPPHQTGGTVDVTLTYKHRALALGTSFDAFTPDAAAAAFESRPGQVRQLRRLLTHSMYRAGFVGYQQEWWHFELGTRRWAAVTGGAPRYGPAEPASS